MFNFILVFLSEFISLFTVTMEESDSKYLYESERLKSFENGPVTLLCHRIMAACGLYHKERNYVQCAFCNLKIGNWHTDPIFEHKRYSPQCRPFGNITLAMTETEVVIDEDQQDTRDEDMEPNDEDMEPNDDTQNTESDTIEVIEEDIVEPNEIVNAQQTHREGVINFRTEDIEIQTEIKNTHIRKKRNPSFDKYACFQERIKTYRKWSGRCKIDTLCEAGFFYTGKDDETVCFYCGLGLRNWLESDDPWIEHAKWFSKCEFLIITKGKKFTDEINDKKKSVKEEYETIKTNCKICYSNALEVVFLPCSHLMVCERCALRMKNCGVCRKPIQATIKVFIS